MEADPALKEKTYLDSMSIVFTPAVVERHPFATAIVESAILKNRLAHAYLLTGRAVADKWLLARSVASFLNCTNLEGGDKFAKGSCAQRYGPDARHSYCQNCRWIDEDKHPQAWLALTPEGSRAGKISVDKARQLSDELSKRSIFTRVVVVENASQDVFHRPSANALLKTIEDPKQGCIFFLFAVRHEEVLPTIVSRCQVVPMLSSGSAVSALFAQAAGRSTIYTDHLLFAEITSLREFLARNREGKDGTATVHALELSRQLQELLSDEFTGGDAVDLAVNLEIELLGRRSFEDQAQVRYLNDLLSLAEGAKLQVDHYVAPKAAIESFVLAWWQLKKNGRVLV